jgi:hypothetical protein
MNNQFAVLGISADSTPEEIQDAFDKKRAELSASIEDDQKREDSIAELQSAFDAIAKKNSLVIVEEKAPPKKVDPLLSLVGDVNSPLHNETEFTTTFPCLFCGTKNPELTLICIGCGRQISKPCPNCGKILRIDNKVCNRCNTIILEFNQTRLFDAENVEEVKNREREENQIRVNGLEEHHQKRAAFGFLFWLIVIAVFLSLCALAYYLLNQ